MKLQKSLFIGIASATLACSANAQTVIDIVGSTAGRSAVHTNILAILTGETYAFTGNSSASKATSAIYKGTYNGNPYIIRTYWAGSVNGVLDVQQQIQQTNLLDTNEASQPTSASPTQDTTPVYAPASAATAPEIGYSDVFATSTGYAAPAVEEEVAIIPFKWYKNVNGSSAVTNMTPALVQKIYNSLGELPLAFWSGNSADEGELVYAIGRNNESGTRITTMAESGYGVFNAVDQYTATYTVNNPPTTANVVNSLDPSGDGGFDSGSKVKAVLQGTYSGGTIIGYVGASDWLSAGEAGQELTWNGVPYSVDNLRSGKYTHWGYLHMNSITLAGNAQSFFTGLKNAITASPGSGLETISSMRVARDGDGAPVYPIY